MALSQFNTDQFIIKEIIPHVYHLEFASGYDLAMNFLRFQEYYESPKFYRQFFTLVDYMEWYVKECKQFGRSFTYPSDWAGFNVPSHCLLPFLAEGAIKDLNKYDEFMLNLIRMVQTKEGDHAFYFIGTKSGSDEVLSHEIAHALYTVHPDYRSAVDRLIENLPNDVLAVAKKKLGSNNYHESTHIDEINAYCSTGLSLLADVIDHELTEPFI